MVKWLFICVLFLSSLCAAPLHAENAPSTVKIGMLEYPPLAASNLPNKGYLSELATHLFHKLGYETTITFGPWKRIYEDAKNGKYDAVLAMWYRQQREKDFTFGPILYTSQLVFVKNRTNKKISPFPDCLRTATLGITRGSQPPQQYLEIARKVETSKDELTNLRKVAADRIDLAYVEKAVLEKLQDAFRVSNPIEVDILPNSTVHEPLHLTFSNKSPYRHLIPELNRVLSEYRASSEYETLHERYQVRDRF